MPLRSRGPEPRPRWQRGPAMGVELPGGRLQRTSHLETQGPQEEEGSPLPRNSLGSLARLSCPPQAAPRGWDLGAGPYFRKAVCPRALLCGICSLPKMYSIRKVQPTAVQGPARGEERQFRGGSSWWPWGREGWRERPKAPGVRASLWREVTGWVPGPLCWHCYLGMPSSRCGRGGGVFGDISGGKWRCSPLGTCRQDHTEPTSPRRPPC